MDTHLSDPSPSQGTEHVSKTQSDSWSDLIRLFSSTIESTMSLRTSMTANLAFPPLDEDNSTEYNVEWTQDIFLSSPCDIFNYCRLSNFSSMLSQRNCQPSCTERIVIKTLSSLWNMITFVS